MAKNSFGIPTPSSFLEGTLRRVPKYTRLTFISACVIGMVTHLFMFANKLPNHDDIGHLFSDTYGTASAAGFCPSFCSWTAITACRG